VAVRDAVEQLDERERFIVEKRLMADPEDELSLAELGRRLGVSRERARQLEVRAKRKLESRLAEYAPADAWGASTPGEAPTLSHAAA
jgi:DNA-directed RNA polymerase sigma subunit (sigma70/sigma32)